MKFEVYSYEAKLKDVNPRGGKAQRLKKAKLVARFDDIHTARNFIAGRGNHFLKVPATAAANS